MTTLLDRPTFATADALRLDPEHEAHEPPESRGIPRDGVRLLVSPGEAEPVQGRFRDLPGSLEAGDLLVVNTSATVPAAVDGVLSDGDPVVVHLGGQLPGGLWLVEARRPVPPATEPLVLDAPQLVGLVGGGHVELLAPFAESVRLWLATVDTGPAPDVLSLLARDGRPIRYRYVPHDWPLASYQTAFAVHPGSAEMPSAARPFTPAVVTDLVRHGVGIAPLTLHTGVSSLEGGEAPYPERYDVPASTAALVNATRAAGGHVVAVGTTVVRALETVVDDTGTVHPGHGWTEALVTPDHPVRSVDGLLTGWHEPAATHLLMLEAIASPAALRRAYRVALDDGYRWHEFGDSHLILPYRA